MNVFILDQDMGKSAQMLDDAHLISQINEICHILTANYNKHKHPWSKIGHVNHPVTQFYDDEKVQKELVKYLGAVLFEYRFRFRKFHQNLFWYRGYQMSCCPELMHRSIPFFRNAKTYVNGTMTDDIKAIRQYIQTKPHKRPLKWTGRPRPDWWVTE